MNASKYKHVVLGPVFLKYLDDSFMQRWEKLAADLAAEGVLWVPPEAR
ncbi:MAG: type I restriction-modification system subunit M N-terminal domain-containing protein [Ferrimicrobium acidiphilum]|jgi:type I restriction enzyme M protein